MTDQREEGWFFPTTARKCHFDGGDGRALCGKWARHGLGGSAPIEAGADAAPSPDDCATCRRKLTERKAAAS